MDYPQALKDFILSIAAFCRDETYHTEYQINLKWEAEPCAGDTKDSVTRMSIHINHIYLWYRISIYPDCLILWENKDYKELVNSVLHETCHLFLEPVADIFMWDAAPSQKGQFTNTIERQTQRIANVISALLQKNWWKEFLPHELQ